MLRSSRSIRGKGGKTPTDDDVTGFDSRLSGPDRSRGSETVGRATDRA